MDREELKKLLPAITHFANGGNLWWYHHEQKAWSKQYKIMTEELDSFPANLINIIEDKHFEARKANALGETVEFIDSSGIPQRVDSNIAWSQDVIYRPIAKYPRYFKEHSSGIIVEFTDLTKGIVLVGVDTLQKKTGFRWNCFHPHDKSDWWTECKKPEEEWQFYKANCYDAFELTSEHFTEDEAPKGGFFKFEISKRYRKDTSFL